MLGVELRFGLLGAREQQMNGGHLGLGVCLFGLQPGDGRFTLLALFVCLVVQGLQALPSRFEIAFGLCGQRAGGIELALDVPQFATLHVELPGLRLGVLQLSTGVLHLGAQSFDLSLESVDLGLRFFEFLLPGLQSGVQ